ncbi:MAG: cation:proton antiporter [Candidatus Aenigmarchaeota archaeon]|nr:cation:proton antiporter [Candidatus Aenigmarchaeota archaeon]
MALPILFDIGLIIVISAILAYVAKFLRQPILVAYVIAGIIVGPMGMGIITNTDEIALLSELGIVFLLFSVGLEIDFRKLRHVGFASLAGGAIQIALMFCLGFVVAGVFGLDSMLAIYIGLLLAFSSTMIVAKILADKDELNTMHGRIMLGILLLQDVIAIIVLPLMANMTAVTSLDFTLSITLRGLGLFALAIVLNKFFFPRILDYAAERHEVLFVTAVANCFFFIGASYFLGFSIAIGGFIAGISMANFPYNIEIAGEVHALRDFFSILFFSTLGMQLNFMVIQHSLPLFITLMLLLVMLKPALLSMIYLLLGYGGRTSGYVGLGLGQSSEFIFILVAEMLVIGSITREFYSLLISVVVLSIVITPYAMNARGGFYNLFSRFKFFRGHSLLHPKNIHVIENQPKDQMEGHVIVFGAHRMGDKIIKYLASMKEKFVVIERDPEIVKELGRQNVYIKYGDAENEEILEKVGLAKARLVILTIPYADTSSFVIRRARRLNPGVRIIARAQSEQDAESLYLAGADAVIIPELVSAEKIVKKIDHFRKEKKL